LEVIEAIAARHGAPLLAQGQHWHVTEERGRLIYQDETGLLDLPLPNLPGAHQIENAGAALTALRHFKMGDAAYEAAVTRAFWPARMQRLQTGPLIDAAPHAELWLDGGHNPAAGQALARHLATLPARPTYLVCGMLNTKDIAGYLTPLAAHATALTALSIPGEANTLPAEVTAEAARAAGLPATTAKSALAAVTAIAGTCPEARILICGSLYLAGGILRENG
jgi:dihydrofolate synthase/folylpolyglutamate synthase